MANFEVSASCLAKDGSEPKYEKVFSVEGRKEIMKRFGLTDAQFEQEAADNIARRITNGVRQNLRENGKDHDPIALDEYVASWMPGRRAAASPINAVKKMLKDNEQALTPEANEQIEAILAKAQAEIEAQVAAAAAASGDEGGAV